MTSDAAGSSIPLTLAVAKGGYTSTSSAARSAVIRRCGPSSNARNVTTAVATCIEKPITFTVVAIAGTLDVTRCGIATTATQTSEVAPVAGIPGLYSSAHDVASERPYTM